VARDKVKIVKIKRPQQNRCSYVTFEWTNWWWVADV